MQLSPDKEAINLTLEEASDIINFIDSALAQAWDRYTDIYIVENTSWEDGKKQMNPRMYRLKESLETLFLDAKA